MSVNDFDMEKARELREKAKGPFVSRLRKEFLTTLFATVPFLVLAIYATARWAQTWGTVPTPPLFYALIYGFVILYLAGLWTSYSTNARLLLVLKEIKQLRLDFLTSQDAPLESATGGAESLAPTWADLAARPKRFAVFVAAVFLVPLLTTSAYMIVKDNYRRMHWAEYETFGGQEMLNVHVTADGRARAVSRVSVTKCPSLVATMPIYIAQPDATLESITVDGRSISYDADPEKPNTYNIMPELPENALKNAAIEVVWSFPLTDMRQIQIRGVIPVNSYAINAVIDPGAPYQFSDHEGRRTFNLYWTKTSDGSYRAQNAGTCGIGVEPVK